MNPADLFGTTFACECGKTHSVPIQAVVYSETAVQQLPAILDRHFAEQRIYPAHSRIALVADERTCAVAGRDCESALKLAGWTVQTLIVPDSPHGSPACDDITRDSLRLRLLPCDGFLAVGSGTVSDLVKWIACDAKLPYAMVATAASMNGYASNNIAPAIRGVKRVINGTVPRAILAVPSMISQAPVELTAAGFGDVLAKPVSMADWKLNQMLFDEYYCPLCAQLIRELEPGYLAHPEAIRAREPEAIAALFQALIYSGVSMTMAGTSFPASGGEHLISHALDMTAMARGLKHDYHGRQVGLGTIFTCALYERIFALESPTFRTVTEPTDTAFWTSLADVVEEEHILKRQKAERAVQELNRPGMWDQVRATLAPTLRKAAEIKQCLRAAGAAHRIEDIGCTREHFLAAALHCHQMRERYTVIDLARAVGIMPKAADEIIEEYLV
ncbi:MAG: sn-glycerol-1-phosphate dehydrogenase [Verrucomicrobia bacterium]|nr:sn-glycerol-1-phosphate dehydrogenase [Verrucomicrobiota bacterium]MBU4290886.1 sn-glycerol-1-phosphate dehydrogenase [Verrucomicrobiota bacterium]MBU4429681.1 sn-glycerol-1-phosphate dehydrogenase [Verrucomicrobiota bacterium]MBU4497826.1 sn-glycerol-1-phosphate dehydrogenase [Verrucomicrobiota bacterium]MCG2680635.1 sn-glycerol-1-phosphate dehydrogenase [Kiritimatiellia bacterium]